MTSIFLSEQSSAYIKARPEIRPGYTVRVHERIKEGDKERVQIFEGLVIAVHKGAVAGDSTITVRRIASGVGVEKVFSLHSPKIEKIDVKKVAKVRRAKLFFLRGRRGKSARLSERFTTADEFSVAAAEEAVEGGNEQDIVMDNEEENENNEVNENNEDNEKNTTKPLERPSAAADDKSKEPKKEPKVEEKTEEKEEEKTLDEPKKEEI